MDEMVWRPIDTAPKDGTRIIVFDPTEHPTSEQVPGTLSYRTNYEKTFVSEPFIAYWWEGDSLNKAGWCNGLFCFPTHWMPLPKRPAVSAEGKQP